MIFEYNFCVLMIAIVVITSNGFRTCELCYSVFSFVADVYMVVERERDGAACSTSKRFSCKLTPVCERNL